MLDNTNIKDFPPTIVNEHPKHYNYSELLKNLDYLLKIAEKTSNGIIICQGDIEDFVSPFRVFYPLRKNLISSFKRDDLIILPKNKSLSVEFTRDCQDTLRNFIDDLSDKENFDTSYFLVFSSSSTSVEVRIPLIG